MKTFTILIFLAFAVEQLNSCGVSTHISIANQALQSFAGNGRFNISYRNIILENLGAFYAGSVYPDAMYPSICFGGRYHGVSEDTHWAPFLNASANYIRKTLPKPWNEETRKLLSFIFGVASHQVADITWHSLGIDQGFLQTMSKVNFHGSFSTAHPVGDVGGDIISIFEGDLQDVLTYNWYIPVGDLLSIYKELYGEVKINADVISSCSMLLYAEWIGEKLAGAELFSTYAQQSPFLVEELHSYFLGGKSDMAAWTSIIWSETSRMIENGPSTCDIPKSTLYLRCNPGRMAKTKDHKKDNRLESRPRISLFYFKTINHLDINAKQTSRGVYLATKGSTARKLRRAEKKLRQNGDSNAILNGDGTSKPFVFYTKNTYARFGWSLITDQLPGFNNVLIAGAPWYGIPGNSQHGRVYILSANRTYSKTSYIDIDQTADQFLDGNMENSRFGFALAVVDFNADGLNDLVISAPSEGSNYLNYTGAVYIYYGNASTAGINRKPDIVIKGTQRYYNLGTFLTGADINMDGYKDLIIGSKYSPMGGEQRGSVAVFLSRKMENHKEPIYYFAEQAAWILKGEQNYSWFGHEAAFHDKTSIGPVLIVSAPTYRKCALKNCSYSADDIQSVGKIYAYRMFNNGTSTLLFEVTGKKSLAKFGTSMAVGDPFGLGENDILAVSSPSAVVKGHLVLDLPITLEQAGQVHLLSLKMLAYKKNVILSEAEYVTLFEGDRNYGKFGWHTSWQDVNGDGFIDLVLGSPYRTEDLAATNGGENGAVYIFYGGKSFPRGKATSDCGIGNLEPCPGQKASLYITSNQKFSQFGRKVVSMRKFANAPSVIVSGPRYSVTSLNNGAIFVFPQMEEGKIWKLLGKPSLDSSAIIS